MKKTLASQDCLVTFEANGTITIVNTLVKDGRLVTLDKKAAIKCLLHLQALGDIIPLGAIGILES